jgi:hypothetical protein
VSYIKARGRVPNKFHWVTPDTVCGRREGYAPWDRQDKKSDDDLNGHSSVER